MTGEDAARIVQSIKFVLDNKDYSDEVEEALDMAVKALRQQPYKDWLSTFNTESATACYTAVQRLKESVDDRLDEGYKG